MNLSQNNDKVNEPITDFSQLGYEFLSNFFPCEIRVYNQKFPTLEHAFQACKATNSKDMAYFTNPSMTAAQAKRYGKKIPLRTDWELVKLEVMKGLLRLKFQQYPFGQMLLETGNAEIIEGNTWGDRYWGVCNGKGLNHLGRLLTEVRDELRSERMAMKKKESMVMEE